MLIMFGIAFAFSRIRVIVQIGSHPSLNAYNNGFVFLTLVCQGTVFFYSAAGAILSCGIVFCCAST
jgi:hypothetical protein